MAAGSILSTPEIHPAIREQFPSFPNDLGEDGLFAVIDRIEEGIVNHPGAHTPGIDGGIVALRGIRTRVEEGAPSPNSVLQHWTESVDFQLRNNLHRINIGETNEDGS